MGSINDVDPAQAPVVAGEPTQQKQIRKQAEVRPRRADSTVVGDSKLGVALTEAFNLIQGSTHNSGTYEPSVWVSFADALADCAEGVGETGKNLRQVMVEGNLYVRHIVAFILNLDGRDETRAVDMVMSIVANCSGLSAKEQKFCQRRSYYACMLLLLGEALVPDDVWKCPLMTRKQRTRVQSINGQKVSIAEFQEAHQGDAQWSVKNPWVVTPLMDAFLTSIKADPSLLIKVIDAMEHNAMAVPSHAYLIIECLISWEPTWIREVLAERKCSTLLSFIRQFSEIGARDVVLKTLGIDSITSTPLDWRSLKALRNPHFLNEMVAPVNKVQACVGLLKKTTAEKAAFDCPPAPTSSDATMATQPYYVNSSHVTDVLAPMSPHRNAECNIPSFSTPEASDSSNHDDKENVSAPLDGSSSKKHCKECLSTSTNSTVATMSPQRSLLVESSLEDSSSVDEVLGELASFTQAAAEKYVDDLAESWEGVAHFVVNAIQQTQTVLTLAEKTAANPSRLSTEPLSAADSKRSAYDPVHQFMVWMLVNGEDNLLIRKCIQGLSTRKIRRSCATILMAIGEHTLENSFLRNSCTNVCELLRSNTCIKGLGEVLESETRMFFSKWDGSQNLRGNEAELTRPSSENIHQLVRYLLCAAKLPVVEAATIDTEHVLDLGYEQKKPRRASIWSYAPVLPSISAGAWASLAEICTRRETKNMDALTVPSASLIKLGLLWGSAVERRNILLRSHLVEKMIRLVQSLELKSTWTFGCLWPVADWLLDFTKEYKNVERRGRDEDIKVNDEIPTGLTAQEFLTTSYLINDVIGKAVTIFATPNTQDVEDVVDVGCELDTDQMDIERLTRTCLATSFLRKMDRKDAVAVEVAESDLLAAEVRLLPGWRTFNTQYFSRRRIAFPTRLELKVVSNVDYCPPDNVPIQSLESMQKLRSSRKMRQGSF